MRITPLLATLALASASLGVAAGVTTTASAAKDDRPGVVQLLEQNPGAARDAQGQEFKVRNTIVDPDGTRHVRMDRTYRGLPVVGGDLVVHQGAEGALDGVSQTLRNPLDLVVKPLLGAKKAGNKGLSAKNQRGIAKSELKGVPGLVVDATGATPKLAWEVITTGVRKDGTPSRLATYIDARAGGILRTEEQIHTVEGEGQSIYSGTVPVHLTQQGSSYVLTDPVHGNGRTTDAGNKTDTPVLCPLLGLLCAGSSAFNSDDDSFGDGTNGNRESAAVDAHYGAATTYDYFLNVHGRDGIFGDGTGTVSRVHYGNNYVNAFWDGEKMTYGDGDGVNFGPLVSLDVAGHEMTHGITENTANLTYSGESGGLNEATSDIFGTLVEFHAANPVDPGDYFIGEQFDLAANEGLRRMDNPELDGKSHSCWSSSTKSVDVHYSSGVGNHFFYLLAEGSGQKTIGDRVHNSPTCDGSTVDGIGRDAAGAIWFRALDVYMTSSTNYAQARTATLTAAADLYGADSAEHAAVAAAWSAVNVS